MREFYPEIEPYSSELLDVGGGQLLHVECSGNPDGKPAVFVHGGPGGGTSPAVRRFFDPAAYRIVVFDQRGCGQSQPHIADAEGGPEDTIEARLRVNTTQHLIADMERIREYLGIERWLVFGGSWGSTLSLAYAEAYPERVTELVLRGIFLLRRSEIDWYYNDGASHVYPDEWENYLAPLAPADRVPGADKVAAYDRLLRSADPDVATAAAIAWTTWEKSTSYLINTPDKAAGSDDARYALAFARIENHYFMNHGFLHEAQLLRDVDRIRHIPGVIVQGRYDVVCPARSAWDLHRAWPEADLHIIPDAGHASFEPGIRSALIEATDRFRTT
ncbi:prolyl aminopeptidase [Tsukamurella sp. 8F]|uniref:prolyl aminopeptidase n=1 Tax=unclassified Tsukamurella TaxID=2633480 RepID=UPI0023B90E84|nr:MULTISPECIES: prolyl aminopeptidase [unclassified Tsukamurella]MDF0529944.1 prolyl aminopeptidase [Tsukamurella sp. 8J]MDF0587284.1 prolyl aminopeptidase [Tsukamurella sp. 8F]